jgi:hypothetical protein
MGFIYDELIPVAILYDNSGLTKEEYAQKLSTIGPCDSINTQLGLVSVAEFLRLKPRSDRSINLRSYALELDFNSTFDYWRHTITQGFHDVPELKREGYHDSSLWVYARRSHRALPSETIALKKTSYDSGDLLSCDYRWPQFLDGMNAHVISVQNGREVKSWRDHGMNGRHWHYADQKLHVIPFTKQSDYFIHETLDDLFKQHSEIDPEVIWDFDQQEGSFRVGWRPKINACFRWRQENGRLYVDKSTFDGIPLHFSMTSEEGSGESYGFTDLILTAETIRTKYWKMLEHAGLRNLNELLSAHPDVIPRYERAIWDAETSLFAKRRGMTHTQLLRFRMGVLPLSEIPRAPPESPKALKPWEQELNELPAEPTELDPNEEIPF